MLLVRPDDIDADDQTWTEQRHDLAQSVATGNAVLAGIAAADAICVHASGERYRGPDHRAAADHLERVTGDKTLGRTLRELVDLKDAGHYGVASVSRANAPKALRRATRLIVSVGLRTAGRRALGLCRRGRGS